MSTSSRTRRARTRARAESQTPGAASGHRGPGAANPVVADLGTRAREVARGDLQAGIEPGGDAEGASSGTGMSTSAWSTVARKGRAQANVPAGAPATGRPNPSGDALQLVQTRVALVAEASVEEDPVRRLATALATEHGSPSAEMPGGTPMAAPRMQAGGGSALEHTEQAASGQTATASGRLDEGQSRRGGTPGTGDALGSAGDGLHGAALSPGAAVVRELMEAHASETSRVRAEASEAARAAMSGTIEALKAEMAERDRVAKEREATLMAKMDAVMSEVMSRERAEVVTLEKLRSERGRWGDSEELDDEESVTTSATSEAFTLKGCYWFSATEMEAFACDMTRSKIVDKVAAMREELADRCVLIEELLDMPDAKWRDAVKTRSDLHAADRFVRRACRAMVKGDGKEAKVFRAEERELRKEDRAEARYGRALLERMEAFGALDTPRKVRAHVDRLEQHAYLSVNMSEMEARAGLLQLVEEWRLLPKKERDAIDIQQLTLKKVPTEIKETADRSYADRLRDEIAEHETLHGGEAKYSLKQLTDVVAVRVGSAGAGGALLNVNAVAAADEARKAAAEAARRAGGRKPKAGAPCWNCGKLSPTCKGWFDCTAVGQKCGVKGCPCVRAEPCVFEMDVMPPREEVKQGGGEAIAKQGYDRLAKLHKTERKSVKVTVVAGEAADNMSDEPRIVEAESEPHRLMVCAVRAKQVAFAGGQQQSSLNVEAAPFAPRGWGRGRTPAFVGPTQAAAMFAQAAAQHGLTLIEDGSSSGEGVNARSCVSILSDERFGELATVIDEPLGDVRMSGEGAGDAVQAPQVKVAMLSAAPPKVSERTVKVEMLLDTGADGPVMCEGDVKAAWPLALASSGVRAAVDGIGGTEASIGKATFFMGMPGGVEVAKIEIYGMGPSYPMPSVISHATVEDQSKIIRYAPEMTIYDGSGGTSPITRRDDVYWVDVILGATEAAVRGELVRLRDGVDRAVSVARARARVGDVGHLWAARYCVSSQGLQRIAGAVDGVELPKLTKESAVLIDTDEAYVRAWKNAATSKHERPAKSIVVRAPGQVWALDEWKASVPSLYGKCTVVFHVNLPPTGFGYAGKGASATVEDWIQIGKQLQLEEALHEHKVILVLADAGVFRHEGARNELQVALQCVVRAAAGDDHDAVTAVEGEMDCVTRMTEASMFRAKNAEVPVPDAAMVECRMYQRQVLNQRPTSGEKLSRMHLHCRVPASVRTLPPYLFWTRMAVASLPTGRGPKGLMDGGRTRTGRVIGMRTEEGLRVLQLRACDTREVITRKSGEPLDEHALLNAGVVPGSAVVEAEMQTDSVDEYVSLQVLKPLPEPTPVPVTLKTIVKNVVPEVELPEKGSMVDVLWKDAVGSKWDWWRGKVVEVQDAQTSKSGKLTHMIEYVRDPGNWYPHDLARDRYSGVHPWIKVPEKAAKAQQGGQQSKRHVSSDGPRTRAKAAQVAVLVNGALDDAMEHVPHEDGVRVFNALATHLLGTVGDDYECRADEELEACRLRLRRAMYAGEIMTEAACVTAATVMAGKKVEKVTFKTKSGDSVTYEVPKGGKRAVERAPDAIEWKQSDRHAFYESIMRLPGNEMMPEEELIAMGYELIEMVTSRRYKTNEVDGTLDKRKSRHSLDEARLKRMGNADTQARLRGSCTYTIPVGDLETKVFFSEVGPDHHLKVVDWTDGYGIGEASVWTPVAAKIPDTIDDAYDDQGRRLAVLLRSPLWGSGVSGFGFEIVRDIDCEEAGWITCPSTPGMKYRGEDRAIVIIDDMMMRTTDPKVATRTHEVLSAKAVARGGKPLTIKDAGAFGGLRIMRSDDRMVITLMMPEFIERAAQKWIPEFVSSGKLPEGVPSGKALRKALDAMELARGEGRLNKEQREVQAMTGDVRWMTRVLIRLIRACHKMSCVAQGASAGSGLACRGVIAVAYVHRFEGLSYGATDERSMCLSGFLAGTMDSPRGAAIARIDGATRLAEGAPKELDGAADATWSLGEYGEDDVYALAITSNGGCICADLKKVGLVLKCSALTEGVATLQLSDKVEQAINAKTSMGAEPTEPVVLASDCEANLRVAAGAPAAQRLRHALRRWAIVTQRCQSRAMRLAHLPDEVNWVDFFTKWKDKAKVEASLAYLTNLAARLAHPATGDQMLDKVKMLKDGAGATVLALCTKGSELLCTLPWLK